MFKKMTTLLSIAGMSAAMVMSAAASAPSADEILQNYVAASKETNEVNCVSTMKADVSIDLPDMDTTFGVSAEGSLDTKATLDPLTMYAGGSLNFSMMGDGGAYDIELYVVPEEDGTIGAYVTLNDGEEDTGWQYSSADVSEIGSYDEILEKSKNFDFSQLPFTYTAAEETVEVNGHTCYRLYTIMTWDELMAALPTVMEAMGEEAAAELPDQEEIAQVGAIFEGLRINVEISVDAETYKPVQARIDTEGSDWTSIAAVFASYAGLTNEDGSLMNVNIGVNELYIEFNYDDAPVEITLPEEALAAKESGESFDLDDIEELASEVG